MIGNCMYTTILTLYKQGMSHRGISKVTGVHRKTIRKIVTAKIKGTSCAYEKVAIKKGPKSGQKFYSWIDCNYRRWYS